MDTCAKIVKKKEQEDVTDTPAVIEECGPVSEEIQITVLGRNQKWTFQCDKDETLANTMFIPLENLVGGKCMLHYDTVTTRRQMLDRTKTPSFYGMIYDDIVYLGGVIRPSDQVVTSQTGTQEQPVIGSLVVLPVSIVRLYFLMSHI